MFDAIVIGAGPAGISASLYLKRANKNVLVLYYGLAELEKAHQIDNYYGFPNGISGKDLYQNGIEQAKNLEIPVKNEEVLNIMMNENFHYNVVTKNETYEAKTVILATGNKRLKPNIPGIKEYEGKGVSYCAICDGFFYRKKKVAVLGNSDYAMEEAKELSNVTKDVYILTDGKELEGDTEFEVIDKEIQAISGEERVKSVLFADGTSLELDGVFVAEGIAGGANFAKKLGIYLDGDKIVTDENMATNIPGVYVCGNLAGGLLQVNKAVYEGAVAALSAVKYINEKR